jgi:predicted O-methyltransferase YrrM
VGPGRRPTTTVVAFGDRKWPRARPGLFRHGQSTGLHRALQRTPHRLAIEEIPGAPVRIQPTIGSIAAGLVGQLIRSGRIVRSLEIGASLGCTACALGHAAQAHGGKVLSLEVDERIERYNRALQSRLDLRTIWLPIGDGVAVSVL